jgi:hypothetical protein
VSDRQLRWAVVAIGVLVALGVLYIAIATVTSSPAG